MSLWSLNAPLLNSAKHITNKEAEIDFHNKFPSVYFCFQSLVLSLKPKNQKKPNPCLCDFSGVLCRSLSSSSSSLDSRHGPAARPRPLPRQRPPARPRRHRVFQSPRSAPSPAQRSLPDTPVHTGLSKVPITPVRVFNLPVCFVWLGLNVVGVLWCEINSQTACKRTLEQFIAGVNAISTDQWKRSIYTSFRSYDKHRCRLSVSSQPVVSCNTFFLLQAAL